MNSFTRLALATLMMVLLAGCSKEDPNPQLRDPIFQDLEKRANEHQKAKDEAEKQLLDLKTKLAKAEPNTLGKRDIEKDIRKNEHLALESSQWALYYKIRTERRRIVDKLAYGEALANKKPWPDPNEYSEYLVNRRLVEANRNWNARVPKLQSRLPSSQKASAHEKKAEE